MDNDWGDQLYAIRPHREGCTQIECDCCYSHPAEECVGVDVNTAAGKKHLTLCRIHAGTILQRLAKEAGEHLPLMTIIKKKEEKEERAAVASGERMTLSEVAR
jgi:hypothetical protein